MPQIRISIWINSKKVQQAWLAAPDSQTRLLFTLEPWVPPRHLPIDMFVSFNHLADVRVSYVYTLTLKCKCESPKECEDQRYCTETQVASDVGTRRQDGAIGAFFVSNCGTGVSGRKRMQYLERMVNAGRQISPGKPLFHSYGKCLRTHSTSESKADVIDRYPFYISFESSELDGYVTEKFFEGFLLKRAIMVYLGPTDAPSHSPGVDAFIDARQFPSPEALVKFLNELARSPSRMREYHMWKQQPLREEFLRGAAQRNFLWHGPDSVPCRICKQFNATKCAHT